MDLGHGPGYAPAAAEGSPCVNKSFFSFFEFHEMSCPVLKGRRKLFVLGP